MRLVSVLKSNLSFVFLTVAKAVVLARAATPEDANDHTLVKVSQ